MALEQTLTELQTTKDCFYLSNHSSELIALMGQCASDQTQYNALIDGMRAHEKRVTDETWTQGVKTDMTTYRVGMLRFAAMLAIAADNNIGEFTQLAQRVADTVLFSQGGYGPVMGAFLKYTKWTPEQAQDLLLKKAVPAGFDLG